MPIIEFSICPIFSYRIFQYRMRYKRYHSICGWCLVCHSEAIVDSDGFVVFVFIVNDVVVDVPYQDKGETLVLYLWEDVSGCSLLYLHAEKMTGVCGGGVGRLKCVIRNVVGQFCTSMCNDGPKKFRLYQGSKAFVNFENPKVLYIYW